MVILTLLYLSNPANSSIRTASTASILSQSVPMINLKMFSYKKDIIIEIIYLLLFKSNV